MCAFAFRLIVAGCHRMTPRRPFPAELFNDAQPGPGSACKRDPSLAWVQACPGRSYGFDDWHNAERWFASERSYQIPDTSLLHAATVAEGSEIELFVALELSWKSWVVAPIFSLPIRSVWTCFGEAGEFPYEREELEDAAATVYERI